jgi:chromosome segregation ATPase
LARRASWMVEALGSPRNGLFGTERDDRMASQCVEGVLEEIRDVVGRVQGLEEALLTVQATAAERDEAASTAATRIQEAGKREEAANASIKAYAELKGELETERASVKAILTQLNTTLRGHEEGGRYAGQAEVSP